MASKHSYDVTINGETYTVDSEHELTDAQAYQYAKSQAPFDVKKQNEVMRANMAKQPEGTGVEDTLASFAHAGPMANMDAAMTAEGKGQHAKAIHQAVVGAGKVTLPAALPLVGTPAGVGALALGISGGVVGDIAGRQIASTVTDNPDYIDVAGDVGGLVGGGTATKVGSMVPVEPILRFAGTEMSKPGGVQGVIGKGLTAAADAAEEATARAHGPISKILETSPETVARQRADALAEAAALETKTKAAQHDEAIRTNRNIDAGKRAAAKNAKANAPAPSTAAEVAAMMRERLSGTAGQDAAVAQPERVGPRPEPQGTGQERIVDQPLYRQQATMDAATAAGLTPAEPPPASRTPSPTFAQEGIGGRGQEVTPPDLPEGLLKGEPTLELVDTPGPNASGESAASAEALSRMNGMAARGERFVVRKGNTTRPLVGPDAVDYVPQSGETFGIMDKDGNFQPLSQGNAKTPMSLRERALVGARGKGALSQAERVRMHRELTRSR